MDDNIVVLKARRTLISASKAIPFVLCALICVSYVEIAVSLACDDLVCLGEYIVPNVPFSWLIGQYFEYSYPLVVFLLIIVYAMSTCKWNKFACYYVGFALFEKSYFNDIELYVEYIYAIVAINVIISCFLVFKGVKLVTNK